jgi:hypothetical protein
MWVLLPIAIGVVVIHFDRQVRINCSTVNRAGVTSSATVCGEVSSLRERVCQSAFMTKRAIHTLADQLRNEAGDVPGWVLITLMTAGLVIVIWGLAGPALSNVFQQAIARVTSF